MIDRVRRVHGHVRGTLQDGTPYAASDPESLAWVHVAEATTFLEAWIRYADTEHAGADRDRYFAEMAVVGAALGADPGAAQPGRGTAVLRAMRPKLRWMTAPGGRPAPVPAGRRPLGRSRCSTSPQQAGLDLLRHGPADVRAATAARPAAAAAGRSAWRGPSVGLQLEAEPQRAQARPQPGRRGRIASGPTSPAPGPGRHPPRRALGRGQQPRYPPAPGHRVPGSASRSRRASPAPAASRPAAPPAGSRCGCRNRPACSSRARSRGSCRAAAPPASRRLGDRCGPSCTPRTSRPHGRCHGRSQAAPTAPAGPGHPDADRLRPREAQRSPAPNGPSAPGEALPPSPRLGSPIATVRVTSVVPSRYWAPRVDQQQRGRPRRAC